MGARVRWREDRKAWFLYVYQNGTQAAERFGPAPSDKRRAERRAKEIDRELRNGRLGLSKPEKPVPFDAFASQWVEEKVQAPAERGLEGAVAPKTAAMREQMVRLHLAPVLGSRDVRTLDGAVVDALETHLIRKEWGEKKKRRLSRRSIDMALGTLRIILAHAKTLKIVTSNAVDDWKEDLPSRGRRRTSSPRKRITQEKVLEATEREQLLEAFQAKEPHCFPLVLFLAETGCRISEPLALTWEDVDLFRSEVRVYRKKTGDFDYIELSDRLSAVLRRMAPDLRPRGLLVFRTPQGTPVRYENFKNRVWDPLVVDLFGKDRRVTPHTLRHTWASLHLSRGTPLEWVRRMGGWASKAMLLDTYYHFLPREMRGFSNALGAADRTTPNQTAEAAQPSSPAAR